MCRRLSLRLRWRTTRRGLEGPRRCHPVSSTGGAEGGSPPPVIRASDASLEGRLPREPAPGRGGARGGANPGGRLPGVPAPSLLGAPLEVPRPPRERLRKTPRRGRGEMHFVFATLCQARIQFILREVGEHPRGGGRTIFCGEGGRWKHPSPGKSQGSRPLISGPILGERRNERATIGRGGTRGAWTLPCQRLPQRA